jgi:hypothetical protein
MHVHPDLRALRADDTPQRAAQAELAAAAQRWRADARVAEVLADVDAFATCRPLAECAALSALFDETAPDARDLAASFVRAATAVLAAQPLGHVVERHFTDGTLSLLQLARAGNVSLALVALDGAGLAARPEPRSVDFGPNEMWEHVIVGSGEADLVECRAVADNRADLRRRAIALHPGKVICRDADRQSLLVRRIDGCLVSLRLQRRRAAAGVTREFALADGALIHQAAGNPRDSRVEMMLALLGRMGRSDAAPLAAAIAREPGSAGMRWQALREALALDTLAGMRALAALAADPADELHQPASALRAQLVTLHPQLAEIA